MSLRCEACTDFEKQILQKRIHSNFQVTASGLISAPNRPAARRPNLGRSYSMRISRFGYKPLAMFSRHIISLLGLTANGFARNQRVVRQYLARVPRNAIISKMERVRTVQVRTLLSLRKLALPVAQTSPFRVALGLPPLPALEAVPQNRPIFRSSTYAR